MNKCKELVRDNNMNLEWTVQEWKEIIINRL